MPSGHNNNFDFLRFAAAAFVWYGHCYALTGRPDPSPPLLPYLAMSQLGVAMFFIISGYFVTSSYAHRASLPVYIRNRALRILPALVVVVLLAVFVLGPLITTLSLHNYFAHEQTWKYLNSAIIFPLHYNLPGVFEHNPITAVNGSLWTLKQEVRCYGIIALLGLLGLLRPGIMLLVLALLLGLLLYGTFSHPAPERLFGMKWGDLHIALQLGSLFAAGALLYLARDHIALNLKGLALACLLMALSLKLPPESGTILFDMSLAYAVLYLGFLHLPRLTFGRKNDFSYGIYLYSFPMQQLTFCLLGGSNLALFMVVSFALTFACAAASWFLVEKPALALKGS